MWEDNQLKIKKSKVKKMLTVNSYSLIGTQPQPVNRQPTTIN